jgi:hypothetical protein
LVKQSDRFDCAQELSEVAAHANGVDWHQFGQGLCEWNAYTMLASQREPLLSRDQSLHLRGLALALSVCFRCMRLQNLKSLPRRVRYRHLE